MKTNSRVTGAWLLLGIGVVLTFTGLIFLYSRDIISIVLQTPTPRYYGELVPTLPQKLSQTATAVNLHVPTPPHLSQIQSIKRAGFAMGAGKPDIWAARLGVGWYLNWGVEEGANTSHLEYWKMVRVGTDKYEPSLDKISELARRTPGQVWIVGNEPDVIWQDNVSPEIYARAYHDIYQTIKAADPSALVAVGGVAQGTPLRLAYLDAVLQAYQSSYGERLPADWWTIHGYVLREQRDSWGVGIPPGIDTDQGILYEIKDHGRLDLFEKQLRDFRTWMELRGYRQTPLALTEFGILMPTDYGFPPEDVAQYLHDTFQLLYTMQDKTTGDPADENHLVQRWAWFSLSNPTYPTSDLADLKNDRLTLVGEAFRDFVISHSSP